MTNSLVTFAQVTLAFCHRLRYGHQRLNRPQRFSRVPSMRAYAEAYSTYSSPMHRVRSDASRSSKILPYTTQLTGIVTAIGAMVKKICYARPYRQWAMAQRRALVTSFFALFCVFFTLFASQADANPVRIPSTVNGSPNINQLGHVGFLVLFYLPTCPHCQRFAPVIKAYANQHHVELVSYSMNNQPLSALPHTVSLTVPLMQAFFNGKNAAVPALFFVDQRDADIYPVSVGEESPSNLTQRLQTLVPLIEKRAEEKAVQS